MSDPAALVGLQPLADVGGTREVVDVALTADGRRMAATTKPVTFRRSESVRVWDLADPAAPRTEEAWGTDPLDVFRAVAFVPGTPLLLATHGKDLLLSTAAGMSRIDLKSGVAATARYADRFLLSPDGRLLVTLAVRAGRSFELWDTGDPRAPRRYSEVRTRFGDTDVGALSAATGLLAVAVGWEVVLYDVADPARPTAYDGVLRHPRSVQAVAMSPDGGLIATGSDDRMVRLWDVTDPEHPTAVGDPLAGHRSRVGAVAFCGDRSLLASGSLDATVRLWDLSGLPAVREHGSWIIDEGSRVTSLAAAGDLLVAGHTNGRVRVWGIRARRPAATTGAVAAATASPPTRPMVTLEPLAQVDSARTVIDLSLSSDGRTLAVTGQPVPPRVTRALRVWDVTDPAEPRTSEDRVTGPFGLIGAAAFVPGERLLVAAIRKDLFVWDLADPASRIDPDAPAAKGARPVRSLAFSSDGRLLACGGGGLQLWDTADPRRPSPYEPGPFGRTSADAIALSPDDTLLAAADGKEIRLWDVADPARPAVVGLLRGHRGTVRSVAFSPDGGLLASGGDDTVVRLWDVADPARPAEAAAAEGHVVRVTSVRFGRDRSLLVSGGRDGTVRLWDASDLPRVREHGSWTITLHRWVTSLAVSRAGDLLVAGGGDRKAHLWSLRYGTTPG